MAEQLSIAIDVGGTFTDVVAATTGGRLLLVKVPTTPADPAQGETGSFLQWTVVWTLATAFVALVLTLGPTLLVSTCV